MIKINILSGSQKDPFGAQWDKVRYPESEFLIKENSTEDIEWDVVIVYENIKQPARIKCREGNLIYFAGEPPMMRPLPNKFISQFDEVYIPNLKSKHYNKHLSHGFLNWSLGVNFKTKEHRYSFEQIRDWKPVKNRIVSIVTSNKRMMPGHNKRMRLIERLMSDFPGQIDFYGAGHNFVDYKVDALLPYKFHICMENSEIPYYWTEKISDPVLANCIPIYCGCTNISDYLDNRGYLSFSFDDYEGLKAQIESILKNPEQEYEKYRPYMEANKNRIMNELNLIPFTIHTFGNRSGKIKQYSLLPLQSYKEYWNMFRVIRAKRFLYKMYSRIIEATTKFQK